MIFIKQKRYGTKIYAELNYTETRQVQTTACKWLPGSKSITHHVQNKDACKNVTKDNIKCLRKES